MKISIYLLRLQGFFGFLFVLIRIRLGMAQKSEGVLEPITHKKTKKKGAYAPFFYNSFFLLSMKQ
ncbi:MAG: hypothetical protein ABS15_04925 [SAR86 cluster bacterium BACL1 MAG-120823-bin87]|uniref:Uncharacterized protein n=1 Tax=SAR86 cluster bacterium BACL1 MAG-120820-bin45 TaxID=1655612 RepID=A0A0R2UB47_9GAMM|nr:MAG: hypothetical protein ABS10_04290 [SAR86 cluster bacterium BACL1 MAG-120820-bin45]KRO98124.1 MAG: hypothetical protein ABS15_04925 [SAR86 cluster bacterium BACL1 MAG-120823-bin87]